MLLSIIIPTRNQCQFIERTLDSIFAQRYRPIEVIVVDGASTDHTTDILRKRACNHPELRWISEPDDGPADAVNKGFALATGEIAAIQSSDDIYYPDAFSIVMDTFRGDEALGFVIGHYSGIDKEDRVLYTQRLPEFSWEAYFGMALCIPQSSIFFRMSVAREAGGWNAAYFGCDLDFWLRVLLRTRAKRVDRVLSGWRLYAGARTHSGQRAKIWDGYWRMIADNELLRAQPAKVRRLASASRHILALQHHPTGARWAVRWHALLAFVQHPSFWRYQNPGSLIRLLPGYSWIAALYRRVGRMNPTRGANRPGRTS